MNLEMLLKRSNEFLKLGLKGGEGVIFLDKNLTIIG
jgi:hypothetical protein